MKQKVLMLGWEFPPLINGGLGVASLGISQAISNYVNLSLIIPQSDISTVLKNANLIGLNIWDYEQLDTKGKYEAVAAKERIYVQGGIDPYYSVYSNWLMDSENDLYGKDIEEKISEYTKLTYEAAKELEFDIIHAHDWMTFQPALKIKFLTKKPLVLHIHSLEYDRTGPHNKGWVYELEKNAMEKADRIIAVSNYTRRIIHSHYGIDTSKIDVVHNAVSPISIKRQESSFPEKLITFIGRISGQKGPVFFVETAIKICRTRNDVRFVMAGDGELLPQMIEKVASNNLGDRFHFTRFLPNEKVRELLGMADLLIMPSVSEPFGLVALEAAQAGVPNIISRQSGVSEVLAGAVKTDYWDTDKMVLHANKLLDNPELANEVVQENFSALKYDWDQAARKIVNIYQTLLD